MEGKELDTGDEDLAAGGEPAPRLPFEAGIDPEVLFGMVVRDVETKLLPVLPESERATAQNMAALLRAYAVRARQIPEALSTRDSDTKQALLQEELAAIADVSAQEREFDLLLPGDEAAKLEISEDKLTTYLREKALFGTGEAAAVKDLRKVIGGFSKQTILATVEGRPDLEGIVIRRDIRGGTVRRSAVDEFPLLKFLFDNGLPVPEPLISEPDPSRFGMPFIITRRAAGVTIPIVQGLNMLPEHAIAARGLATVLAQLHALDPCDLDFPVALSPTARDIATILAEEVADAEAIWRAHRRHISPAIEAGFAWLKDNIPKETATGRLHIVHGDASLHNLMMCGDQVSAMLDWELGRIGDAAEDLVYCREWVNAVMDWDEFLAIYRSAGGIENNGQNDRFYSIFTDLRVYNYSIRGQAQCEGAESPSLSLAFGSFYYERLMREKIAIKMLDILQSKSPL